MLSILNTSKSLTRIEALNTIIIQMKKSLIYTPIAYMFDGSGCSCCLSEYFYLICKIKNEYKILHYDGYIKHTNSCALIRCSCKEPFTWKNINPIEINCENIVDILDRFISIINHTWYDDFIYFIEQQRENKAIQTYNENEESNLSEKNYDFYFSQLDKI